jgi:hypothetical protein
VDIRDPEEDSLGNRIHGMYRIGEVLESMPGSLRSSRRGGTPMDYIGVNGKSSQAKISSLIGDCRASPFYF